MKVEKTFICKRKECKCKEIIMAIDTEVDTITCLCGRPAKELKEKKDGEVKRG